jgi:hypothetical protein
MESVASDNSAHQRPKSSKMKIKRSLHDVLTISKRYQLLTIMLLSLVCQIYQVIMANYCCIQTPDYYSYKYAAEQLLNGHLDILRTPIYPGIMAICQLITTTHTLMLTAFFQVVAFYGSIICLYKAFQKLNIANNITFCATLIYSTYPALLLANIDIETESFATSFCVFALYCFVNWYKKNSWWNVTSLLLCTVLLVFLRPSFLYLIVTLTIIAVIYFCTARYKQGGQLLSVVGITALLLLGYCQQMKEKTGVFTMSSVLCCNEYVIAENIGLLTPDNVTDPAIKQILSLTEEQKNRDDAPQIRFLPLKQRTDELNRIKSNDPVYWYVNGFKSNLLDSFTIADNTYGENQTEFSIIYLVLLLAGGYIVYDWYRKRSCPIMTLFLWLMCTGNLMVNLLGSYAEWTRLFLPSTPLFIMLVAAICNLYKIQNAYSERQLP